MLQFFIGLQAIAVLVSIIAFLVVFKRLNAREHAYLVLLMLSILISNLGYLIELTGKDVSSAYMGTSISYLGKVFISYLFFLYAINVCRVNIPMFIKYGLFIVQSGIYGVIVTTTKNNLYYTDMRYETDGFFPHIVYDHGAVYYVFISMMIVYFIAGFIAMMIVYRKEQNQTQKKRIRTLLIILCTSGIGLCVFFADLCKGFDTTSIAYTIMSVVLLYSIIYEDFMGTLELAKDVIVDSMGIGIAVTDTNNIGIYTNLAANEVIKNIEGESIEDKFDMLLKYSKAGIRREYNGVIYQFDVKELNKEDAFAGYLYNISDVTEDARYAEILENAITEKVSDVKKIQHSIIASFADMVEARDTVTGAHVKNTSAYVRILVDGLADSKEHDSLINRKYAQNTIEAAPLHDIGKIAVSDTILKKPGKLTDEEFEQIKAHSKTGAQIIEQTLADLEEKEYLNIARDMAMYHHERWDGKGYPEGIAGEDIPLCARVMAIADVYDALRSKRSYKDGFSKEKSRNIIKEGAGTQFDPMLVDVFFDHIDEIEAVDAG